MKNQNTAQPDFSGLTNAQLNDVANDPSLTHCEASKRELERRRAQPETAPATAHTIQTRFGNVIHLLGRRPHRSDIVWAVRLTDANLREYHVSDLIHENGASALLLEIGALPTMRPATAALAAINYNEAQAKGQS